jgi:hypothetical protein
MVGLVALDLILGVILRRAVGMSLVVEIARVDFLDLSLNTAGFRVPGHMVADLERLCHLSLLRSDKRFTLRSDKRFTNRVVPADPTSRGRIARPLFAFE